jgi:hypothetical protein
MGLSKSNRGAVGEYRVALALLAAGWLVFRCMTPNSPVDLILCRRGHVLKCQVKSTNQVKYGSSAGNPKNLRQGSNDVLAVVLPDQILYKVRTRRIQRMFPGSVLARPPKRRRGSHSS